VLLFYSFKLRVYNIISIGGFIVGILMTLIFLKESAKHKILVGFVWLVKEESVVEE